MDLIDAQKATRIKLFDWKSVQMRSFHLTWVSFFLCFFGWFGIAPLMAVVREDLDLSKSEISWTIIASVAITIVVRLVVGPLCDRIGPRKTYAGLMILGAFPVMGIGLANSFESFLLFRLAIGGIGASFVITQYHTSVMFAPNVVGTATATTAGWGNLGGGVTLMVMPLIFAAIVMLGAEETLGWRLAMVAPGMVLLVAGAAYYQFTEDCPAGNYRDLRRSGAMAELNKSGSAWGTFRSAAADPRVWFMFLIYGACFGTDLTILNIGAIYFFDSFDLDLKTAGLIAGLFGLMSIFARTLGGVFSDKIAARTGLGGRVHFLFIVTFLGGVALIVFSQMRVLGLAIAAVLVFSLFVKMAQGATFSIVPFMNRHALGAISGIVGAGGNAGAVAAGFLFKSETLSYADGLLYLGIAATLCSVLALFVRFSPDIIAHERQRLAEALALRAAPAPVAAE
ncbi:MAG: MFS transporter [Rhodospirillaceae bacterium]|jgi:NNP family nitrate/nitrite transporter-like MFS transporter|nr:MFS transporter [Rhodospirillaceae bacterium]MBT3884153.1 MFS transporter [Rhodospirillaceae bacterium]MBT4118430.1 MFS transporter [Rhodospirillaceae bacterium]MBT4674297.1 MFS transporter [Rhodospirillaceae bacterium]MBT4720238.1 MFS transporter [Rhodospirillaceae bacterium]